jgi:RHS repeat-associated protein
VNPLVTTSYDDATHDATGDLSMIDRPGGSTSDWRYAYSSWGQLTVAERTPGSSDVLYTTDALDRVLQRTSGGTTTLYASTPGGPLAQKVGSTTRYYVADQHGDTVGWTDTTGTLKGTALYDPWGQVLSSTGEMATVPAQGAFGFQSDLTDTATGQVDMGVRAYEPTLGRFSSPDPLLGELTDPISLNRYLYGGASPITYADPTGLKFIGSDGGGGGSGCGRICQQTLEDIEQLYPGEDVQSPAAAPGPPPSPEVMMPPFRELRTFWRQSSGLSPEDWSQPEGGAVGTIAQVLVALFGGSLAEPFPGRISIRSSGVLESKGKHGYYLLVNTLVRTRTLNPESGAEFKGLIYTVVSTSGQRAQVGYQPPRFPLPDSMFDASHDLLYQREFAFGRSFGRPVAVTVTGIVSCDSCLAQTLPMEAVNTVTFP